MLVDFKRTFFPTKEQKLKDELKFRELTERYEQKLVLLKPYKDGIRMIKKPLGCFINDCCNCNHYEDSKYNFVIGGYCDIHKFETGCGFTCNNFSK